MGTTYAIGNITNFIKSSEKIDISGVFDMNKLSLNIIGRWRLRYVSLLFVQFKFNLHKVSGTSNGRDGSLYR
jgi:hypothetical protein